MGLHFTLQKAIVRNIQALSFLSFQKRPSGDYLYAVHNDIDRVTDFIFQLPLDCLEICLNLLFILGMLFYLDWRMTCFSLAVFLFVYTPVSLLSRRANRVQIAMQGNANGTFALLKGIFSHMYLVKALKQDHQDFNKVIKMFISKIRLLVKQQRDNAISGFLLGGLQTFAISAIAAYGGFLVAKGRMSAGTLAAVLVYFGQLASLQGRVFSAAQRFLKPVYSGVLDELLFRQQSDVPRRRKKNVPFNDPLIEFKKVSFGFRPGQQVIEKLTFTLCPGVISLVGRSGCGKTTILNLIMGLYQPIAGMICINGRDLQVISDASFMEQIGVALQEPFLWTESIENNIRYGRGNASRQEIIEAARKTGADDFISLLPDGYQTIAGEDSCKLSAGQKQKISIARALIRRPKILILDETFSSMDSASEERIIAEIKKIHIPMVIIVSHRLSTVMACDTALFLKAPDTIVQAPVRVLAGQDDDFNQLFSAQQMRSAEVMYA